MLLIEKLLVKYATIRSNHSYFKTYDYGGSARVKRAVRHMKDPLLLTCISETIMRPEACEPARQRLDEVLSRMSQKDLHALFAEYYSEKR
ncbi:MAG: hypothetical protein LBK28_05610, partial [Propionibacteriaceae bacterium]|nr:hypothetical protein [Propionibacteriaceae bacterium]